MSEPNKPNARAGVRSSSSPLEQQQAAQAGNSASAPGQPATSLEPASGLNPTTSQAEIEAPIEAPFDDEPPLAFAALSASPVRHGTILGALEFMRSHYAQGMTSARALIEHPQGLNPNTEAHKDALADLRLHHARVVQLLSELSPAQVEDAG